MHEELTQLRVEWPETPDLASAVRARLDAAPRPARRPWPVARPAWQLAVAAVLAVVVAVAAIPPARSAVLDWLGFSSVRIERRAPSPPAFPRLDLGREVSLAAARRQAPWLLVPAELGDPDAVYVAPDPIGGVRVSLVYAPRPGLPRADETGAGLLVMEFEATVAPVIQKSAGPDVRIERLTVGGDPAFFLSGAPHGFAYAGEGGVANFEDQRLAGNTLLVERADGVLLRIEGKLSRARAVALAESVR